MIGYPASDAERVQLADELTRLGFVPTQDRRSFFRAKVEMMIAAMLDGSFDWAASSLRPVILGPSGEVLGGHHRVVAAAIVGIDLTTIPGPRPQVQQVAFNHRPVYDWVDVLPD